MVDKSDIFADDYWKEQWKAVIAKERTAEGDDVSLLGMSVQLARRWGPKFCPECEAKSKKLLDLVDAAYKILSARRKQMLGKKSPFTGIPIAETAMGTATATETATAMAMPTRRRFACWRSWKTSETVWSRWVEATAGIRTVWRQEGDR